MARTVFITGGTRSGKSAFAQQRAEAHAGPLLYVATAGIGDEEMAARVERHRQERGGRWETLEEPLELAEKLPEAATGKAAVLLDCVTLWVSNLYFAHEEQPEAVFAAVQQFIDSWSRFDGTLYLVSNEVGSGIVPDNRLARDFRDLAGEVNQRLAAAADEAWLVAAGLPLQLK